jgi:small subunit ribosomal protein S1
LRIDRQELQEDKMQEKDLAPWEVPPDEAYWQALLQEEEDLESGALVGVAPAPAPAPVQVESPATLPEDPPNPLYASAVPQTLLLTEVAVAPTVPDGPPPGAEEPEPVPEAPAGDSGDVEPVDPQPENDTTWQIFAQHRDSGTTVELTVESYNRGGLLVRWEQVVGFVPASQLCDGLRYGDEQARLKDLATRVGSALTLKVIEVDATKNRLILSERAARHVADPDLNVLDELNPGDVCDGQVTNLCTFGAFVDLGGVEGLIHISELSWGRVTHPADILQSGENVEVYVLNVDRSQGRVGLSLKRLLPDPWNTVSERYQIGQVIEGEVTNIVNFGAFVRLEEGLEGLIHTSELNGATALGLSSLREGARVLVRINSIEGERHRIGLSLE